MASYYESFILRFRLFNRSIIITQIYFDMLGLTFYSFAEKTCITTSFDAKGGGGRETSLTLQRLIEVPVSNQESERSCIFVLGVSIVLLSMIFL